MPTTQTVHGGGTTPVFQQKVYYTGSDALQEGYALCYNFDAYDVSPENLSAHLNTGDLGADDECPARRLQVEKPSFYNSMHFAGVVARESNGTTGPGWVTINRPGSVCNIYCAASVDHADSSNIATGEMLVFSTGQYYFEKEGIPGSGAALILQDVDRSSTNGLVMAELMTGLPSGGYCALVSTMMESGTTVSAGGSVVKFPRQGVIANPEDDGLTSDITIKLLASDASWKGQTVMFTNEATVSAFVVTISGHYIVGSTLEATGPQSIVGSITEAGESITATWNGGIWQISTDSGGVLPA